MGKELKYQKLSGEVFPSNLQLVKNDNFSYMYSDEPRFFNVKIGENGLPMRLVNGNWISSELQVPILYPELFTV